MTRVGNDNVHACVSWGYVGHFGQSRELETDSTNWAFYVVAYYAFSRCRPHSTPSYGVPGSSMDMDVGPLHGPLPLQPPNMMTFFKRMSLANSVSCSTCFHQAGLLSFQGWIPQASTSLSARVVLLSWCVT